MMGTYDRALLDSSIPTAEFLRFCLYYVAEKQNPDHPDIYSVKGWESLKESATIAVDAYVNSVPIDLVDVLNIFLEEREKGSNNETDINSAIDHFFDNLTSLEYAFKKKARELLSVDCEASAEKDTGFTDDDLRALSHNYIPKIISSASKWCDQATCSELYDIKQKIDAILS